MIVTRRLRLETQGEGQIIDLTDTVAGETARSGMRHGLTTVFVTGTTAGVAVMEHEPGLALDWAAAMERLVPRAMPYEHNERNNDDNGHSHTRAMLLGPSLTVPVEGGALTLGRWQRIVLLDYDSRPRVREVVLQCMGE